MPSLGQGDGGLRELNTEMHGVGNSHQVFYLMLRRWGYNRHEQHSAKLFELLVWCQGVGGRSEFGAACQGAGGSLNMCSTMLTRQSTYHLPPPYGGHTTSQPRMRNSAKLVSSLRQGDGGLSKVGTAGQCASRSLDMW